MFNTAFEHLFRAVNRVKSQLETGHPDLRPFLAQELRGLRQLSEQYIDDWMELEEQIIELMDTYELHDEAVFEDVPLKKEDFQPLWTVRRQSVPVRSTHVHFEEDGETIEAELGTSDINLAEAVFSWSDDATLQFRRGLAYFDLHMFKPAEQALQAVLTDVDSAVVRLYLAAVLALQGDAQGARSQLERVFADADDELMVTAALEIEAQLLLGEGNIRKACELYRVITRRMPEYLDAWFNLGLCEAKQNNYNLAEAAFSHVLYEDPCDIEACLLLSSVQQYNKRLDAAYQTCRLGLHQNPSHPGLRLQMSRLLHQMGHTESSLKVALHLADEDLHNQRVLSFAVWLLLKTGQGQAAVGRLKRYLSLHRNHPTVLLQLGVTHLILEQPEEAEPILWGALPSSPDKSMLWLALGAVSSSKGAYSEAQKRYLRAMRDPRSAVRRLALYQYALSLQAIERFDEAETYLHAAHVSGSPSPAILSALANNAEMLGHTAEAERHKDQAHQLAATSRDPESLKQDEF